MVKTLFLEFFIFVLLLVVLLPQPHTFNTAKLEETPQLLSTFKSYNRNGLSHAIHALAQRIWVCSQRRNRHFSEPAHKRTTLRVLDLDKLTAKAASRIAVRLL